MSSPLKPFGSSMGLCYCPDCTVDSGTPTVLQKSTDSLSAYCRYCDRTYRNRDLVLESYNLVSLLWDTMSKVAPEALREQFDLLMEVKVERVLGDEKAAAEEDEK